MCLLQVVNWLNCFWVWLRFVVLGWVGFVYVCFLFYVFGFCVCCDLVVSCVVVFLSGLVVYC